MVSVHQDKIIIRSAEILSVGTELLIGQTLDTDAYFLSGQLAELGISTYRHTVVGDNAERIRSALEDALDRNDLVITSGGLGPTEDDITGVIAAEAAGARLVSDPVIDCELERRFEIECRQRAFVYPRVPEGARLFPNDNGTAPGALMIFDRQIRGGMEKRAILILPGPPSELEPMFLAYVRPVLAGLSPARFIHRYVHLTGIGEPASENALRDLIDGQTNPTIAPYVKDGEVMYRITQRLENEHDPDLTGHLIDAIQERLGKHIFEIGNRSLPEVVYQLLLGRGATCAFAESCTAGLASAALARIPGASSVLSGGVVVYSNALKMKLLGVSETLLERRGAVSEDCARAMAEGLMKLTGSDFNISVTGYAGPSGGDADYPVGTVFMACTTRKGTHAGEHHFHGNRKRIQDSAVMAALDLLRRSLLQQ